MSKILIVLPQAAAYLGSVRRVLLGVGVVMLVTGSGCGGSTSSSGSPAAPVVTSSGPVTTVFTGTTMQTGVNGCSGDSHKVTLAEGELSVTLEETSDRAGALSVQLCLDPIDTGVCSIKQQKINVGQTLTGVRVGAAGQLLKFLPYNCVFGNTFDPTPVTYRARLTYQQ